MRLRARFLLPLLLLLVWPAVRQPAVSAIDLDTMLGTLLGHTPAPDSIIERLVSRGNHTEFVGTQKTILYRPRLRSSIQKVTQKAGRRRILFLAPASVRGKVVYNDGALTFAGNGGTTAPDIGIDNDLRRLVKQGLGKDHVAGRPAYIVELRPRGRNSGSRRVWVDAAEWVPLRWEDRDSHGTLVSKSFFTSIQFHSAIPDTVLQPPAALMARARELPVALSMAGAEKLAGFNVVMPGYIPKGFHRRAVMVTSFGRGSKVAQRVTLSFSNGLSILTLVQAPVHAIKSAPRPGKVCWSPPGLVWVRGHYHFVLTATPPLSRAEMLRIADSVR